MRSANPDQDHGNPPPRCLHCHCCIQSRTSNQSRTCIHRLIRDERCEEGQPLNGLGLYQWNSSDATT